jgi:hypothetical protein
MQQSQSNVRTATGIIVDEKREPVEGTERLNGAKGAEADAVQKARETLRSQFIEAASILVPAGSATKTWLERITDLMRSNGATEVNKALAPRQRVRGEKATTQDVMLSETRTIAKAFYAMPPEMFNGLVQREDGSYLPKPEALTNIRHALEIKAQADREAKEAERLGKAAEALGFKGDEVQTRIDEAIARNKAEAEAEAEAAKTPEGKVDRMARALIKLCQVKQADDSYLVDWTQVAALRDRFNAALTEAARKAADDNALLNSERTAFGIDVPERTETGHRRAA